MSARNGSRSQPRPIRCAIYTRKSSEEGLEQEFNSLDAQRESAEAYVASQQHEGWICLPDRYDDGGFTGGNMERPALKRLLTDIKAGKIDCVIVYKVDRLSRSLLDFARMMSVFEEHGISFVSVTQQFNTTHSMGRLTLNILLSFAQFEREIISERTRDKIAAARRKGKWAGGHPVLGYDIDPRGFRLVVNEEEAARVRDIFELYLEHQSLIPTVQVLNERSWLTKHWITRKGKERGGRQFDKGSLYKVLTNIVYIGKVKYKDEVHEGEHDGIVDADIWQRVQRLLVRNGRSGGVAVRNKHGALLKGLLYCEPCGCSMGHTYATKNGKVRYRYYVCLNAQKRGWSSCPSKSIPAEEIERFVVEQIRAVGREPVMVAETFRQAREQAAESIRKLERERATLERQLKRQHDELRRLSVELVDSNGVASAGLAQVNEQIRTGEQRLTSIREELLTLSRKMLDEREVARALSAFEPVWDSLSPKEQARVVQLLVKRIDYDGERNKVRVTFHPTGLRTFAEELKSNEEEAAA